MSLRLPIVLLLVGLCIQTAQAAKYGAVLMGERSGQKVTLVWSLTEWPASLSGFSVARRQQGGEWQAVLAGLIVPGLSAQKDLSPVEADPARRRALQEKFLQLKANNQLTEVTAAAFIEHAQRDPLVLEALRSEMLVDYDRALFFGLGQVDRNVPANTALEYGLFAGAATDNTEALLATLSLPVDSAVDERAQVANSRVDVIDVGNLVRWQLAEPQAQALSVFAFDIYRSKQDEAGKIKLNKAEVASAKVVGGKRFWQFIDRSAEASSQYQYTLVPINVFKTELLRSTLEFSAGKDSDNQLSITALEKNADGSLTLRWEFSGKAENFRVDRIPLVDNKADAAEVVSSALLAADIRDYTDTPGKPSRIYRYEVNALADNKELVSDGKTILNIDSTTPAPPATVTAVPVKTDGKRFLHIQWQHDQLTNDMRGCVVYSGLANESIDEQISPVLAADVLEFYAPLSNLHAEQRVISVACLSTSGMTGDASEITVDVPGAYVTMPPAVRLSKEHTDSGTHLRIVWDYPEAVTVAGFRVRVNQQLQASEDALNADSRQWLLENVSAYKSYFIEVQAVSPFGNVSAVKSASYIVLPE